MSGSLQGAGGIGGLLAWTDNPKMKVGDPLSTAYYFADAGGNIVGMVFTNGLSAARYSYDPFGGKSTMSDPLSAANKYRFSSKELSDTTGLYYYGFRFYDPSFQKWLNCDPLSDGGGLIFSTPSIQEHDSDNSSGLTSDELLGAWSMVNLNLQAFALNNPIGAIDSQGLQCIMLETEIVPNAIAESGGMQGLARAAIDTGGKVAESAGKEAAENAAKKMDPAKEIEKVQKEENALDRLKDIERAQNQTRTGQYERKRIDNIGKSRNNANKLLKDIANDPSLADDLSAPNVYPATNQTGTGPTPTVFINPNTYYNPNVPCK